MVGSSREGKRIDKPENPAGEIRGGGWCLAFWIFEFCHNSL